MGHKKRVWDQLLWLGVCLLLMTGLASATTLTGTLRGPDGNLLNGNLYLSFSQQVALLVGCGGPALIPPGVQAVYPVTNGAMTGTAYGLNCITPSSNVYYHAVFQDQQGNKVFDVQWNCITGSAVDVGTCAPIAINPTTTVVQGPQGPQGPATIAVGTTTTGPPGTAASVTNSGTPSAFVLNFTIPRGDTGAVGTAPNYGASFTSQTSVTIAGSAHAFNTANVLLQCYDNSSPAKAILPASWSVNTSTFDVTVNFATAQSGYCALAGGRGPAGVPGPTCSNVPAAWSSLTAYTTGQCAINNSNLWFALQNSTNQTPGYTSAFWLSLGGPGPSPNVFITGGSIDGTPIGATTPSTGKFTSIALPSGTLVQEDNTNHFALFQPPTNYAVLVNATGDSLAHGFEVGNSTTPFHKIGMRHDNTSGYIETDSGDIIFRPALAGTILDVSSTQITAYVKLATTSDLIINSTTPSLYWQQGGVNEWQMYAGASHELEINDRSTNRNIFTIVQGAPAGSVLIDSAGVTNSLANSINAQGTATAGGNFGSGVFTFNSSYWTGTVAATDAWKFQVQPGTGANPFTTLYVTHQGSAASGASTADYFDLIEGNTATAGQNFNSTALVVTGSYWTGTVGSTDNWYLQGQLGTGTNPTSTVKLFHTGTSGALAIDLSSAPIIESVVTRSSYEDVAAIAPPGNPASGGRFYVDNTTGNLACKNSVGASCLANAGQRTCAFGFGAQNGPVLATADINPQPTQCYISGAATITSVILMVDTGTSSVNLLVPNGAGGTISLTALTPATVTNIADKVACANAGGTAITIGRVSVTCSALSVSTLNAGDVINSGGTGAADGTTHRMTVFVTYQLS